MMSGPASTLALRLSLFAKFEAFLGHQSVSSNDTRYGVRRHDLEGVNVAFATAACSTERFIFCFTYILLCRAFAKSIYLFIW